MSYTITPQSANLASLLPTMNQLFRQGIAPSTWHVYKGGFNHYRHFCLMSNQQLFPVSEVKLLYLVTHLSRTLALWDNQIVHVAFNLPELPMGTHASHKICFPLYKAYPDNHY